MKQRIFILALLMGLISFANAQELNTLTKAEQKAGWKLLFDGKNIDQWRFVSGGPVNKGWKVINGILNNSGAGSEQGGDIMTNEKYENFELYLEWKIASKSNSGVFYRVQEGGLVTGPEYQLIDDKGWPDKLDDSQYSGANYAMNKPIGAEVKPLDEWNITRIVVKGDHVQHFLNGKKVVDYRLWTDEWKALKSKSKWKDSEKYGMAKSGYIGLQDHGGLTQFRNIKIKVLK